jgi:hypothetical protein
MDEVIAKFFYGCNIPLAKAEHPLFKKMLYQAKKAPASYTVPTRHRLAGDLLQETMDKLKADGAHLLKVSGARAPQRESKRAQGGPSTARKARSDHPRPPWLRRPCSRNRALWPPTGGTT